MRHVFIEIGSGALVRADGVGMMQGVKSQAGKVYFVCRGGPGGASGPSVDLASYAVSMMFLAGNYPRAGFEEQWRAEGIAEEVLACPSTQGLAHDALGTALGMCSVRSHSTAQVHDQRLVCHAGRCPASWRSAEGEAARQVPLEALAGLELDPGLPVMRALGVSELSSYLSGAMSLEEAAMKAKTASRRYAKRQMTWARRFMADWTWVPSGEAAAASVPID